MIKKSVIVYIIFLIALCYIISPWFFEKKLLFNELLAMTGILILVYKQLKIGNDFISRWILFLLAWGGVHVVLSLFLMDSIYYYLRNMVILYSIFSYFIGYYCYPYLKGFITKAFHILQFYIGTLLIFPVSSFLFERFGMATLFPALFKNAANKWILPLLIVLNIIYAFSYDSATSLVLSVFYFFLLLIPGFRFFKQVVGIGVITFCIFFISVIPNLSLISKDYHPLYNNKSIYLVMNSHPLLGLDGNSTWRLVLWKQIIIDRFPHNILGLGFGTPALQYYPVEDPDKVASLPYVLGAHNSFVYLFGRLGLLYIFFLAAIYTAIFREYFYYKGFHYKNKSILLFFSFFAITIIALFNPTLESPIYASTYWLLLGFLARAIYNRKIEVSNYS